MAEPVQDQKVTVGLLAVCQGLSMSGTVVVVTVLALAGAMIAENPAFATLPVAFQFIGTMTATIPASLLMGRIGRRAGFTVGQILGALGCALSIAALVMGSLWVLCAGALLIGAHQAHVQYMRFAAADCADDNFRPRAISYVLAGGIAAALFGPWLSNITRDLMAPLNFAGAYAAVIALCFITIVVLQAVRIPRLTLEERRDSGRPMREIARQPAFIAAVTSSAVGYGTMVLVMTATPIAMLACGFAFEDSTFIIGSHVVGMYLPSFFTGHLIVRFGVLKIIVAGAVLTALCMVWALAGIELINFWGALVILGVGWNFLFIGGTTLLTRCYTPSERAKTQAAHDFIVFSAAALGSLSAGALHAASGWNAVNMAIAAPVLVAVLAAFWLAAVERRAKSPI
ncbi:MAG: MFS transporter [Rhodospirillales bacterium]